MPKESVSVCEKKIFDAVFKEQAEALRNYLFYRFGELSLAEDLVQEAFIKLWDHCKNVTVDKARAYLYKVAINDGNSSMRHNQVRTKHHKVISDRKQDIDYQNPEFLLLESEFKVKLEHAISALTERQRQIFLMSRMEDLTYREIAAKLDVSIKTIEKQMHKALISLRETVKNI